MWSGTIIVAIALMLTGATSVAQQVEKISPGGTRFLLYTPPSYNESGGPYPLLIVLHGQGGLGDNLNLLRNKDDIPSKLIDQKRWPASYPFIVVTPQLKRDPSVPDPAEQTWPAEMVDEVVEYVRSHYTVDANKIYVTGLSQGAHGSYDYSCLYLRSS
jgi:predicted peptidase